MYQSPISVYETAVQSIMKQRENAIFAKVQYAFDVQLDKEELIRALQYDRGQYDKGYRDGLKVATDTVRKYLIGLIEEWDNMGDRKYDLPNMQVYNHIRKELDDLEEYSSMHFPDGDCK